MQSNFNDLLMNTKFFIPAILTGLTIAFSSCEKIVDNVDLGDAKPKLVVFAYINPGADTIFADVSLSRTINQVGSYYPPHIDYAEVVVSKAGGQSVTLQFDPALSRYYAAVGASYFETGHEYQIHVKTPDGKEVEAFCSLPLQNTSLRITKADTVEMQDHTRYRFRLEFDDISGQPDHYRIIAKAQIKYDWEGYVQIYDHYGEFSYGEEFIAVKDRDGDTFISEVVIKIWGYYGDAEELLGMQFFLLSTDEHYYHFHRSLQRYEPENPFSEPTIVYSNVSNGLGVFAGFNPFSLEYKMGSQK
jgi:hypothetical protein